MHGLKQPRHAKRTGLACFSCVWLMLFLWATAPAKASGTFDSCRKEFLKNPEAWASSRCFYVVGQREGRAAEAARHLKALATEFPNNYWLVSAQGHVAAELRQDAVERVYLRAADGFAGQSNSEGEVLALQSLHHYLRVHSRLEETLAQTSITRMLQAAEASADPMLLAQVRVTQAMHWEDNYRFREAYHALRMAEEVLFPEGSAYWQRICLEELGVVTLGLRRNVEAKSYFQRLVKLTQAHGARFTEANARFGLALLRFEAWEQAPKKAKRQEVVAALEEALAIAQEGRNPMTELRSLVLLGRLADQDQFDAYFRRCLLLAEELEQPMRRAHCLRGLASRTIPIDPEAAMELMLAAEEIVEGEEHVSDLAYILLAGVPVNWAILPEEKAFSRSLLALEAIESIREIQGSASAGVLDRWHQAYYQLSGLQLATAAVEGLTEERLRRALDVLEKVRARALLDSMATPSGDGEPSPELAAILERKVEIQRRLLHGGLGSDVRISVVEQLEEVELEEAAARMGEGLGTALVPELDLEALRSQLGPDRALLSYQLAPSRGVSGESIGGSWLVALTEDGHWAHALPDPHELEPMLSIFLGLLERRDGSETGAAARLHEILLKPALDNLPPEVRHLVIVPDGLLHRLPFAALRPSSAAPVVATSFELSLVPSITLWRSWSAARPEPVVPGALVLADPELPGGGGEAAGERAWAITSGASLGALPYARREGRALRRLLDGSALRIGEGASELALEQADLSSYGVLHLAAHAVIDDTNPARSAVILSPGGPKEDGLLQPFEIADLALDGKAVVLSACQGASGALFKGEGVMSLSRAFFQAGAHAVVGSLWPLRDDEAAKFFAAFYEELAQGTTTAGALAGAQRALIRAGAPTAAWAGLVTLGDGDLRPVLPSPQRSFFLPLVLGLMLLLALASWWFRRAKKSPRYPWG